MRSFPLYRSVAAVDLMVIAAGAALQAFTWDINDSMYSDELNGEADDNLGPATRPPVMRSSSDVSDHAPRLAAMG